MAASGQAVGLARAAPDIMFGLYLCQKCVNYFILENSHECMTIIDTQQHWQQMLTS